MELSPNRANQSLARGTPVERSTPIGNRTTNTRVARYQKRRLWFHHPGTPPKKPNVRYSPCRRRPGASVSNRAGNSRKPELKKNTPKDQRQC